MDANLALNLVSGLSKGDNLFIVESTGAVSGMFAGLPQGQMFTKTALLSRLTMPPAV